MTGKGLYRFSCDCGRMGDLDGLFVATQEEVDEVIGKEVYFGEVLGKHSEIFGVIEENEITLLTTDPLIVGTMEQYVTYRGAICGYNPVAIYRDANEDYDDTDDDWEDSDDEIDSQELDDNSATGVDMIRPFLHDDSDD